MDTKTLCCLAKFPTNSTFIHSPITSIQAWNPFPHHYRCKYQATLVGPDVFNRPRRYYKFRTSTLAIHLNPGGLNLTEKFRTIEQNKRRRRWTGVRAYSKFNGGGGNNELGRFVFNIALAGGLTYLTVTGKLGWVLDAIVSLWLFAALVPLVGVVAFLWFAGRDMVQGTCPNCGNVFQIFESALKDGPQHCPYCSQPFKLQNKEFVRDSPKFSAQRFGPFKKTFDGFTDNPKRQESSVVVVDVEAEVKDKD